MVLLIPWARPGFVHLSHNAPVCCPEAEFHWKPIDGYDVGTAFEGDVHIEGLAGRNSSIETLAWGSSRRHAQSEVAICAVQDRKVEGLRDLISVFSFALAFC